MLNVLYLQGFNGELDIQFQDYLVLEMKQYCVTTLHGHYTQPLLWKFKIELPSSL